MWAARGIKAKESRNSTQEDVNHKEHFQLYEKPESVREKQGSELKLYL